MNFEIKGDSEKAEDKVDPILAATAAAQKAHPEYNVEQFGDASTGKAVSKMFADDLKKAETLSLPLTLVILLLAFGALVAAGLPLLLGVTSVMATTGLVAAVSQFSPATENLSSVVVLVGLAVGVDYSLFYIRREREERRAGRDPEAALAAAAATSGRAVLVSGFTVMAAMAGMYFTGDNGFASMATGTILVVGVAMIGSLTVLPALLSKLGDRVDKGRIPFLGKRLAARSESRMWSAILDRVLRRPAVSAVLAAGVLVALAIPALGMHTASAGVDSIPKDTPVIKTFNRITAAFPGEKASLNVVVKAKDVTTPEVAAGIKQLEARAAGSKTAVDTTDVDISKDKTVAQVTIPIAGKGTDAPSVDALAKVRDDLVPSTIGKVRGVETVVGGDTAATVDYNDDDQGQRADRVRVRPRPRVHAPAGHVPLAGHPDQGDRAEPAVGRRRLRRARAGLPAGPRREAARLREHRRDRAVAAAVPVRDPVRPVDGLPRVHPQPGPRGVRSRHDHGGRGLARHPLDRQHGHERGDRDGRGVRRVRDAVVGGLQAAGHRPGRGDPARRHAGPGDPAPGHDEAARRQELVPAEEARLAAAHRARAGGCWAPA